MLTGRLREFIHTLKAKKSVPFLADTDITDPKFPEGYILPITEEVYGHFGAVELPRWSWGSHFIWSEGEGPFVLFWTEDGELFALQLSWAETERFAELAMLLCPYQPREERSTSCR